MKKLLLIIFCVSFIFISFVAGSLFFLLHNQSVDLSVLEHYNPGKPSVLLDDEGNEWARFALDKREPIKLDQMPTHLIDAFLAAEDWNFFNHAGISWKGIIRSGFVNLYYGRKVQGASTITQQLVKLLFFDSQKTFKRKLKEQLYALLVEKQFTKQQILQTYLNHIYFGCGIYGVQAACQRFWGVSAADISVAQAATLAGIIRSPGNYCPITHGAEAKKRRNVVLHSMYKLKRITQQEYETALTEDMHIQQSKSHFFAPHLRETIRLFLEDLVGKEKLYCGGLVIQTTLNTTIQRHAEKIFHEQCTQLKKTLRPDIDGALISMDVKTGQIKALIGGYDFAISKFNRALQARRQIGSIIKPLIYASAVQAGMSFADTEVDEPIEMQQANGTLWCPNNYNDEFEGQITLARALSHSNNIVTIKTMLRIGAEPVLAYARACNIRGPLHTYPSLALGCIDATLFEVTGMFNIFANGGMYVEPHYIKWIKDQWGTKIWKGSQEQRRVMPVRTSSQVAKVLEHTLKRVRSMTGVQEWLEPHAISKTGTTNDSRVCWFAGSTPELTTAVYIGSDDNNSMGHNVYPLRTAFPIWFGLNLKVPCAQQQFIYDPSLHEVVIDDKSGKSAYYHSVNDSIEILT